MPVALVPLKTGRKIMLNKPVLLVGRHPDCDVILTRSRKISRKHCAIAHVDDRLMIRDLGSVNGVWVNGKRADSVSEIQVGDQVGIADLVYRLLVEKKVNGKAKPNGKPARSGKPTENAKPANAKHAKQIELNTQRVDKQRADFVPAPEDKEPETEHQMQTFSPAEAQVGSDSESMEDERLAMTGAIPFDVDRDSSSDVVPLSD